jgi:hypothetical protein
VGRRGWSPGEKDYSSLQVYPQARVGDINQPEQSPVAVEIR